MTISDNNLDKMLIEKVVDLFTIPNLKNFPDDECTIQDGLIPELYASPYWYWCLTINLFTNPVDFHILFLRPCIEHIEEIGTKRYWIDGMRKKIDNFTNDTWDDYRGVIGIQKYIPNENDEYPITRRNDFIYKLRQDIEHSEGDYGP